MEMNKRNQAEQDAIKAARKAAKKIRNKETHDYVLAYKLAHPCERCPESAPCALTFHHLDPSQKEFNIGHAIAKHYNLDRIKREIAKCIVLCANCHKKEHSEENHQKQGDYAISDPREYKSYPSHQVLEEKSPPTTPKTTKKFGLRWVFGKYFPSWTDSVLGLGGLGAIRRLKQAFETVV